MINYYAINEAKLTFAPLGRIITDTYIKMFTTTSKSIVKSIKTNVGEVFRAKFGDSNEFSGNVEKLIKQTFNSSDFTIKQLPVNQNPTSGKFESCEIVFTKDVIYAEGNKQYVINKGYPFYVTNVDVKIQNKQLSPQSLGILGKFDRDSLLREVISKIPASVPELILQKLLIYLTKRVSNETDKNELNLNDLLSGMHYAKCSFSINDLPKTSDTELSQEDFENIDESAINQIANDFGEIIGGIFLLNYINGAKFIEYSNNIEEPLIDYKLNVDDIIYGISAKAGKSYNGHKPSSSAIFDKLDEFINGGYIVDPNGNKITLDTVIQNSNYTSFEDIDPKKLVKALAESNKQSTKRIRKQSILLIGMFCDKNLQARICKLFNIPFGEKPFYGFNTITDEEFSERFNNVVDKNKKELQDVLNNIASVTGRKSKKDISVMSNDELKYMPAQSKIGMFLYPLTADAVNTINNNFGMSSDKPDFISSFIQLAFNNKQLYTDLKINKKKGEFIINFHCKSMDVGRWKFYYGGSSNEPYHISLSVQMY